MANEMTETTMTVKEIEDEIFTLKTSQLLMKRGVCADQHTADTLAEAIRDRDSESVCNLLSLLTIKSAQPQTKPKASSGTVAKKNITSKDEIMAIRDPVERQKAIAANISLFR